MTDSIVNPTTGFRYVPTSVYYEIPDGIHDVADLTPEVVERILAYLEDYSRQEIAYLEALPEEELASYREFVAASAAKTPMKEEEEVDPSALDLESAIENAVRSAVVDDTCTAFANENVGEEQLNDVVATVAALRLKSGTSEVPTESKRRVLPGAALKIVTDPVALNKNSVCDDLDEYERGLFIPVRVEEDEHQREARLRLEKFDELIKSGKPFTVDVRGADLWRYDDDDAWKVVERVQSSVPSLWGYMNTHCEHELIFNSAGIISCFCGEKRYGRSHKGGPVFERLAKKWLPEYDVERGVTVYDFRRWRKPSVRPLMITSLESGESLSPYELDAASGEMSRDIERYLEFNQPITKSVMHRTSDVEITSVVCVEYTDQRDSMRLDVDGVFTDILMRLDNADVPVRFDDRLEICSWILRAGPMRFSYADISTGSTTVWRMPSMIDLAHLHSLLMFIMTTEDRIQEIGGCRFFVRGGCPFPPDNLLLLETSTGAPCYVLPTFDSDRGDGFYLFLPGIKKEWICPISALVARDIYGEVRFENRDDGWNVVAKRFICVFGVRSAMLTHVCVMRELGIDVVDFPDEDHNIAYFWYWLQWRKKVMDRPPALLGPDGNECVTHVRPWLHKRLYGDDDDDDTSSDDDDDDDLMEADYDNFDRRMSLHDTVPRSVEDVD